MTFDAVADRVRSALNHAAYTFRSFDAATWRAMAVECLRRADQATCVDCGCDCSLGKLASSTARHYFHEGRWGCRRDR